jgi:hypothetical protein
LLLLLSAIPSRAQDKPNLAATMAMQYGAGVSLGAVAGVGSATLFLAATGCGPFEEKNRPVPEDDGDDYPSSSSGDWSCFGEELFSIGIAVGGYVLGSSLGINWVGDARGHQGSTMAALAGIVAGSVLSGLILSSAAGDETVVVGIGQVLLTQGFGIAAYHLNDRIRASTSWRAPEGFDPEAPTLASIAQGLRPEVKVELLRF